MIVTIMIALSTKDNYSLFNYRVLIVFVPVHFLLLQYHSEAFLFKLTKYEKKKDFCFAKMFIQMMAKLIFKRAVMLGNFTGSLGPVVQS